MAFVAVFAIAALLSLLLTPVAAALGTRLNLVDVPGVRRWHKGAVPRTGGIALYLSFMVAALCAAAVAARLPMPEGPDPKEATRLAGILLGSTFMFVVGLYDDRRELGAGPQLAAQLVAALIAISTLVFIERIMNPFTDGLWVFQPWQTAGVTILWVVGMINTVNFLDGLDGLAAGTAAVLAAVLFVHMYRMGQYSVSLLPLALLGSALGFLPLNFHPARVFMGSGGSFFLGYAMATLGIVAGARTGTVLLVMVVPVLDVAWLIIVRRRGRLALGEGDRRHLHFRLVDLGLSQRQVVLMYVGISAALGILALLASSRLLKLGALLVLGVLVIALLVVVTHLTDRQAT
jgi:UDP-GlcNAc:undecaprenyl-phosphate GlcNAc-1-phosphate transferase